MAEEAGYGKTSQQTDENEYREREALMTGFARSANIPKQQMAAMGLGIPLSTMTESMIAARDLLFTLVMEVRDESDEESEGQDQEDEATPKKPTPTREDEEKPTPPMSNKSRPEGKPDLSPSSQGTKTDKKLTKKKKKKEKRGKRKKNRKQKRNQCRK